MVHVTDEKGGRPAAGKSAVGPVNHAMTLGRK